MKRILFAVSILFLTVSLSAQIAGTTGVVKASSKANLDNITPTPSEGEAVLGLVTGASQTSELYLWDVPTGNWVYAGQFTVTDGTTVDLTLTGNDLTAEVIEAALTAANIPIADAGGHFTSDNLEAALQQLGLVSHDPVTIANSAGGRLTITGQALSLSNVDDADADPENEGKLTLTDNTGTVTIASNTANSTNLTVAATGSVSVDAAGSTLTISSDGIEVENAFASDAAAATGGVAIGEYYELTNSNVYGGIEGSIKRRKN